MITNRAIGAATLFALCCVTPARADVPYEGPITFWGSSRAPSDLAIVVAGLALSAAIGAAGLVLVRSRFVRSPARRYGILGAAALAILVVIGLALEVRREAWHSRNRRWNRPPLPLPEIDRYPVGFDEMTESGKYPRQIDLHEGRQPKLVVLPTPFGDECPSFQVGRTRDEDSSGWRNHISMWHQAQHQLPQENAWHSRFAWGFAPQPGDVVPILGDLYSVEVIGVGHIRLTRVADEIPAEFRTKPGTRTISLAELDPNLFWEWIQRGVADYDVVQLTIGADASVATVQLIPQSLNGGAGPSDRKLREPLTLQVQSGELLTARGRSYKVLNVVPPQEIEGIGHLVGWIEISAEPVKPEEGEAATQE